MFVSKLPPKPNFDVLAAAAPASADRRTSVLALIGNLICSWSNNESLFIYVLMILLRTFHATTAGTTGRVRRGGQMHGQARTNGGDQCRAARRARTGERTVSPKLAQGACSASPYDH